MLVKCPSCRTTYRVGENIATMGNPTFRCSRCKHIFVLAPKTASNPARESLPRAAAGPQDEKNPELSFSFPPQRLANNKEQDKDRFEFPPPEETATEAPQQGLQGFPPLAVQEPSFPAWDDSELCRPQGRSPSLPHNNHSPTASDHDYKESWSMTCAAPAAEEHFDFPQAGERPGVVISAEEARTQSETVVEKPEDPSGDNETLVPEVRARQHSLSTLPYLSLFCCLLLLYFIVAFINRARPEAVEPWLRAIPWLGDSIFKNNHLRRGIDLKLTRPSFQPIPGNREVFVISGAAVNHNPISVRGIQLEGNIYSTEGKEIERQTIWIGNAISSKIIRGMTAQEISDIQKLPPLKRFEITPDESITFAIVFFKPIKDIKYFSCRVLSTDQVT